MLCCPDDRVDAVAVPDGKSVILVLVPNCSIFPETSVTTAVSLTPELPVLTTRIVTVLGVGMTAGGVYRPVVLIKPLE